MNGIRLKEELLFARLLGGGWHDERSVDGMITAIGFGNLVTSGLLTKVGATTYLLAVKRVRHIGQN